MAKQFLTPVTVNGNGNIFKLVGSTFVEMGFYPRGSSSLKGLIGYIGAASTDLTIENIDSGNLILTALNADVVLSPGSGFVQVGTCSPGDNAGHVASTAYADAAVAVETSRATTAEALKAPLISPSLTGTPTTPTASPLTNNTQIASTAYVDAAVTAGSGGAATLPGYLAILSGRFS